MESPVAPAASVTREARVAGLRNFTTPSLEDVERRRFQLLSVTLFGMAGLTLLVVLLSFYEGVLPEALSKYTSLTWLRLLTLGVILSFCVYAVEKEWHLRRLTRILVDERVLSAALSNRLRELSNLSEVGKALNSVLDLDDVLGIILDSCVELLAADEGSIMVFDDSATDLVVVCARGGGAQIGHRQPIGTGVAGWVAEHQEPLLLSGDADPALFAQLVPKDRAIRTALCVPLLSRGELFGVLSVNQIVGSRTFSEYDLRALCLFAEHAAIAIANARLYEAERAHVNRLLELDRLKSEFVATVSHELRTPLTSILGSANTLRRKSDTMTPDQRDQFLAMIERQGRRLLRLIEDILYAGRLEAGEPGLQPEHCDLATIIGEVVEGFQAQPGGERITVAGGAATGPRVYADTMAVQQILSNLVDNAMKYAPGRDPIEVQVDRRAGEVVVSVADRGPGIPADQIPSMFERFRQGDGSSNRRGPGVGLGLYIVRKLVEGLGGRIWCESTVGQGTRFRFTLPALDEPVSSPPAAAPAAGFVASPQEVRP